MISVGSGVILMGLWAGFAHAQERQQARSMVITQGGIAATSQTLASQAGAQILARGGSAIDAAIGSNAVLGVVEPMMCGLGGDLFVIYREANGRIHGMNASGGAPRKLSIQALRERGFSGMPTSGIHTVTVPGAVDGWWRLHQRFGRRPWKELFEPAIYYAEQGFPVTEIIQFDWAGSLGKLGADDNARRIYLIGGAAPKVGSLFRNPELGRALRLVADAGPSAFYRGEIAQALLSTSQRLGGTLVAEDLTAYESEWIQPISTTYRGWRVYEMPPNGQGIAALEMLNIMENFPLSGYGQSSADALHLKIEAQKLAYQDLRRYVADPRHASVPTSGLLSKAYARQRAALIDPARAGCDFTAGDPPRESGNTIYLAVIDRQGNIASWIQSISDMFGSGVVVDGMGFLLHDRGSNFSFDPDHPNALAPGKRPFHTIIPGLMEKDDLHIGFGIMRGSNQAQAHAQFVSNVVDHGMNIQMALEAPRFTRLTPGGCDVMIESRVPEAARRELSRKGHSLDVRGEYSGYMGGGQAVMLDSKNGMHYGASSPRKDGAAIPEPDPYFTAPAVASKGNRRR